MIFIKRILFTIVVASMAMAQGCKDSAPNGDGSAAKSTTASAWKRESDSNVVFTDAEKDAELAAAIAEARRTAAAAQQQWTNATSAQRERWWVKWAATTADGGVEHVWVQPIHWSAFRVEGTLVSPPQSELSSGKKQGDLVSFPIEELSDWMYLREGSSLDDFNKLYEGGFTVKVLEKRFGRP